MTLKINAAAAADDEKKKNVFFFKNDDEWIDKKNRFSQNIFIFHNVRKQIMFLRC